MSAVLGDGRSQRLGPSLGLCYWRCGRPADSYEDLLSRWVDSAFVVPPGYHIVLGPQLRVFRDGITTRRVVQRLATRWIAKKAVCAACNNGWMSVVEKGTKGLLTPLIRGHERSLDPKAQLDIALWACMKAALVDARPGSTDGGLCSESSRDAIFERREPPIDMVVRLAAFDEGDSFQLHTPYGTGIGSAGQELAQSLTTFCTGPCSGPGFYPHGLGAARGARRRPRRGCTTGAASLCGLLGSATSSGRLGWCWVERSSRSS
jgi:hypothetical protein